MSHTKRLAVATTDRMITFYTLDGQTKKNTQEPYSRIEDLPAVPLCLEYYYHSNTHRAAKKDSDESKPIETLLWGDDLGIITKYDFMETNWHICQYRPYKTTRQYLECCKNKIKSDFEDRQWNHASLRKTKAIEDELAGIQNDDNSNQRPNKSISKNQNIDLKINS